MSTAPWWTRFAHARLRLDLVLQACASAFRTRTAHPDTAQDADRLSTVLEAAAQTVRAILERGGR